MLGDDRVRVGYLERVEECVEKLDDAVVDVDRHEGEGPTDRDEDKLNPQTLHVDAADRSARGQMINELWHVISAFINYERLTVAELRAE